MGKLILTEPPYTDNEKLYEWMLQIHKLLSGLGTDVKGNLDADNIDNLDGFSTDDISEGTSNLYITGKTTDDLPEGISNLYITGKTTDDLPEGISNLYLTNERVDDRVNNLIIDGNALTKTYDDELNTLTLDVDQALASADAVASSVSVTSANATDLATVITLANELKADVNQLVTDLNAVVTSLNELKANLRTSGLLAT